MGQGETAKPEGAADLEIVEAEDTPEVFLANLSDELKASEGIDADLAVILTDHLLTVTPHAKAVANARSAIIELASKRMVPAKEKANG